MLMILLPLYESVLFAIIIHLCFSYNVSSSTSKTLRICIIATAYFIFFFITSGFPTVVKTIIFFMILSAITHYLYHHPFNKALFISVCYFNILILSDLLAGNTLCVVLRTHLESIFFDPLSYTLLCSLSKLIATISAMFLASWMRRNKWIMPANTWWGFCTFAIIYYAIPFSFFAINIDIQHLVSPLMNVVIISLYGLAFSNILHLYSIINLNYDRATKQQIYEDSLKNMGKELDALQHAQVTLKSFRHNIKNHLQNIALLIDNKKDCEAKEYISSLSVTIPHIEYEEYTGVRLVDLTLNTQFSQAKSCDIIPQCKIMKIEPQYTVSDDTVLILMNLLSNAIEATSKLSVDERFLAVRIYTYQKHIVFLVENSHNGTIKENGGTLKTSKQNTKSHGLGLSIIQDICQRNGGLFKYTFNSSNFSSEVYFPLQNSGSDLTTG